MLKITRRRALGLLIPSAVAWYLNPLSLSSAKNNSLCARPGQKAFFDINISGPEFHHSHAQYFLPTNVDWQYLSQKGLQLVRYPIAWEKIQPTLNDSLDPTELASIKASIAAAAEQSIDVMVDLHNFGRYDPNFGTGAGHLYPGSHAGSYVIGTADLTQAMFIDVWERLAAELAGLRGFAAYGLMNEPHDLNGTNLLVSPNAFSNAPWVSNGGLVKRLGYEDAWMLTDGAGIHQKVFLAATRYTLSIEARTTAGVKALTLAANTNASRASLIETDWRRYAHTFLASGGSAKIQITSDADSYIQIRNAQLELGPSVTTYVPSPWQPHAQAAIDAIREMDSRRPIYVCGYGYGSALNWLANNSQFHLAGSDLIYEAHQYFDDPPSGTYPQSFDEEGATATLGTHRVAEYLAWLTANGYEGYFGEFGIPADDPRWMTMLENFLDACVSARVPGAYWFYGNAVLGVMNISPASHRGNLAPQLALLGGYSKP